METQNREKNFRTRLVWDAPQTDELPPLRELAQRLQDAYSAAQSAKVYKLSEDRLSWFF